MSTNSTHDQRDIDPVTGTATTGHVWDGIRELNTPLPRWWLWVFYACIAFSIGYWILMPSWPGLNGFTPGTLKNSTRAEVDRQLDALDRLRGADLVKLRQASLEQIDGMFAHLEQALVAIDFLDADNPKKLMPRLKRLFSRTQLETEEVNILRGIARQILKHSQP